MSEFELLDKHKDLVPELVKNISIREVEDGLCVIVRDNTTRSQSLLRGVGFNIPIESTTTLDNLGSIVIREVDGVKSLSEIAEIVYDKLDDKEQFEYRFITFFSLLERKFRYIKFDNADARNI